MSVLAHPDDESLGMGVVRLQNTPARVLILIVH